MEPTSNEPGSDNEATRKAAALVFDSPEQLVTLARQHYANSHPNPLREACPGEATLRASVFSGGLPDDELSSHMFECSDCFRDYQHVLASYRAERREKQSALSRLRESISSLARRPAPAFAALGLLLLLCAAAYLWLAGESRVNPEAERVETHTAPATPPAAPTNDLTPPRHDEAETDATPLPAKTLEPKRPAAAPPLVARREPRRGERARPGEARKPRQTRAQDDGYLPHPSDSHVQGFRRAAHPFEVDLSKYERTRGVGGGGGTITLRRVLALLTLRLPPGARRGRYRLRILDAQGQQRLRVYNLETRKEPVLMLHLSLEPLAPGTYSLELTDAAGNVSEYAFTLEDDR